MMFNFKEVMVDNRRIAKKKAKKYKGVFFIYPLGKNKHHSEWYRYFRTSLSDNVTYRSKYPFHWTNLN